MNFFYEIFNFILPAHCSICKTPLQRTERVVCDECFNSIPIIVSPFCKRCGKPTDKENVCNECIEKPHKFQRARSMGSYEEPLRKMIILFKGKRKISIGKKLGKLMGRILQHDKIIAKANLLVPVPLHAVKQRERGYNQSEILTQEISNYTRIPELSNALFQIKPTKPQKSFTAENLSLEEERKLREANVKDAFNVRKPEQVRDKKIVLIDDVMTTGATLDECASELYKAGARDVFAITCARAHNSKIL